MTRAWSLGFRFDRSLQPLPPGTLGRLVADKRPTVGEASRWLAPSDELGCGFSRVLRVEPAKFERTDATADGRTNCLVTPI